MADQEIDPYDHVVNTPVANAAEIVPLIRSIQTMVQRREEIRDDPASYMLDYIAREDSDATPSDREFDAPEDWKDVVYVLMAAIYYT